MRWQDNEKEYERSVWEIYRKEWETASPEKKVELNKRMRRWQESVKSGLTAQQAYYQAMEEEVDYGAVKEPSVGTEGYRSQMGSRGGSICQKQRYSFASYSSMIAHSARM